MPDLLVEAMQTLSHANNDELDLLELLEAIWAGKFLLLPIVVFFMSVGGVVAFNAERNYETKLPISVKLVPPPFMGYDLTNELELLLLDGRSFTEWRSKSQSMNIDFKDLIRTKRVGDLEYQASKRSRLIQVRSKHLLINSNDPSVIRDVIAFANHVSLNLTTSVLNDVQQESRRLASLLGLVENNAPAPTDGFQLVSNNVVEQLVALRRYEAKMKGGKQIVTFAQPYAPELVSASRFSLLLLFSIAGLITGTVIVLFRAAFRRRRELRLASSKS